MQHLTPVAGLLHGYEEVTCSDAGFQGTAKRPAKEAPIAESRVAMCLGPRRALSVTPAEKLPDLTDTAKAHITSKVEPPFLVLKQQFGLQKARPLGPAKNLCKIHVIAALTNLYLARDGLPAQA